MLASDFIECIPVSFRDDLYHQLDKWYHSKARKKHIDQQKNKEKYEAEKEKRLKQLESLRANKRIN